jgi:hypothetical protein
VRVWGTADGALGETRPTSNGVDDLGNTLSPRFLQTKEFFDGLDLLGSKDRQFDKGDWMIRATVQEATD